MEAELRFATTDKEKEAVYRLRYELYVEDQGLFHDEADHERRWLTDRHDTDSSIVVAEVDGRLVGTIRLTWGGATAFSESTRGAYGMARFAGIVEERDVILVSRLVVRPELRGTPLGLEIFQQAFELAAERNAELILGTCEVHLVNHYRSLGFRPFGALYNHPTNGVLVPIVAVTGDLEYLRHLGAPTLDILRRRTRPAARLEQILARVTEDLGILSQEQQEAEPYWRQVCQEAAGPGERPGGVFRDLSRDEAETLLARSHILTCGAADALIVTGHVSRTLYVLLSGSLVVYDGGQLVARIEEPGAVVGEVAMLVSSPRRSDVLAGPQGARVLALSHGNLRAILASKSPLAAKILHVVARRLCEKLIGRTAARERSMGDVFDLEPGETGSCRRVADPSIWPAVPAPVLGRAGDRGARRRPIAA